MAKVLEGTGAEPVTVRVLMNVEKSFEAPPLRSARYEFFFSIFIYIYIRVTVEYTIASFALAFDYVHCNMIATLLYTLFHNTAFVYH